MCLYSSTTLFQLLEFCYPKVLNSAELFSPDEVQKNFLIFGLRKYTTQIFLRKKISEIMSLFKGKCIKIKNERGRMIIKRS